MPFQMTPNTKFALGVVAAFAVGVSTPALISGKKDTSTNTNDMAMVAAQLNDIQPTAGDASAKTADGPVIATVNGTKITLDQLKAYMKSMPPQVSGAQLDQVFPMIQDQMVVGEIIGEKAKAQDLANDPEVQQRLALVRDNVIRATYLERAVDKRVDDAAQRKEYDAFVKDFKPAEELNAQHILVDDESKAKDIIKKLAGGAKFEDLVKEFSKDKGAEGTGDLGYFKAGDMVKEFSDAAFALKKGDVSKTPVKTQFGYHVIKMNDRRMSSAPTFEQMQPQIKAKLQRESLDTVINELRAAAKIELFDMNGKPAVKAEPAAAKQ
jgi:peptidyl-prolyl cis-trans isomerase C